ncbi:AMP-binding protein [Nocardia sp. NPDC057668]|uniref:AMP-binding protein n=1 Tax=Nocardia sp. NPDC057668 TaxID=3346202 RepID=UPI00366F6628
MSTVDDRTGFEPLVGSVLREATRVHPDRPLLICDADRLTYRGAERRSATLARGLIALGAAKGTHVGLLYPNGPEFVIGALAAARIGAVVVPLSTTAATAELRERLAHSDVRILLGTKSHRAHDFVERLRDILDGTEIGARGQLFCPTVPQLRHVALRGAPVRSRFLRDIAELEQLARTVPPDLLAAFESDVREADPLAVVYTTGSTGAPKGAVHTHGSLLGHQRTLNRVRDVTAQDVTFTTSPFFSIDGFASGLVATLVAGATLLCSSTTDASATLGLLESEKPNRTLGSAAAVAHLARHPSFPHRDLSSVRRGTLYPIIRGDVRPADPQLRHDTLGMAETGGAVLLSGDESDQPERRRGSFGRIAPGFEIKLADPETGAAAPSGAAGELCVRGPGVMQGYHGHGREQCFDPDGWFHTGELVRLDEDDFVYVLGRCERPPRPDSVVSAPDTMHRVVRERATRTPDATAVIDPELRVTYGRLDSTTGELAAALLDAGVGKGTRVGVLLPNGTRWVQIALALTRIGAVLVPLSTLLRPPELRAQLKVAAVQCLVTVEEFRGRRYLDELGRTPGGEAVLPDPSLPALRRVWTVEQLVTTEASAAAGRIVDAVAETVTAADPLVIMFTSGSRGLPKGVIHSHGNAFAAVRSGLDARRIDAGTRLYLPMPFFWVGGFGGGVLSALLAGGTLVTEAVPLPESTLDLLRREGVTLFRGWPDQAETLARHAESLGVRVHTLRVGSLDALLPADVRARPGARANLFGMTESFGPYSGWPADTDMPPAAWGSCGKPFPGMQLRIVDPDDGRATPVGSVGVIQLRGPHVLRGMCGRAREDLFTPDGFYSTGDLGRLDSSGFLFYHGRFDDMFKVSGATVYPSEVEKALRGIAGVDQVFVTNVPGHHGDRVGAAVVCDTARTTEAGLRAAAREVLSAFKVPTVWLLLDSDERIPYGATGKIDIVRLRGLFWAAEPGSGPQPPR